MRQGILDIPIRRRQTRSSSRRRRTYRLFQVDGLRFRWRICGGRRMSMMRVVRSIERVPGGPYFPAATGACPTFVGDSEWSPLVDGASYFAELDQLLAGLGVGDVVQISGLDVDPELDLCGLTPRGGWISGSGRALGDRGADRVRMCASCWRARWPLDRCRSPRWLGFVTACATPISCASGGLPAPARRTAWRLRWLGVCWWTTPDRCLAPTIRKWW